MATATKRETKVFRYFGEGDNDQCYVDLEFTYLLVLESKGGVDFERTTFTFDPESLVRTKRQLRIFNPENNKQFVDILIMETRIDEAKGGVDFARTNRIYENAEDNVRRGTKSYRIYHVEMSPEQLNSPAGKNIPLSDPRVDTTQYVDAEVVLDLTREERGGVDFNRDTKALDIENLPGARELLK